MLEILLYVLAFVFGFAVKATDTFSDCKKYSRKKIYGYLAIAAGVFYGVLLWYIAINWPIAYPLILAVVIAMIIAGKVDRIGHGLGVGLFIVLILFATAANVSIHNAIIYLVPFLVFLIASFADEVVDENLNCRKCFAGIRGMLKKSFKEKYKEIGFRPVLPLATLGYGLVTGNFFYLGGIIVFDLGYYISSVLVQ